MRHLAVAAASSAVTRRAVAQAAGVQGPSTELFGDEDRLLDAVGEHVLATCVASEAQFLADAPTIAEDSATPAAVAFRTGPPTPRCRPPAAGGRAAPAVPRRDRLLTPAS